MLWSQPSPVLTLRDFGLSMGKALSALKSEPKSCAHGQYILVCPDGTIRRLLHAYLTTGMQGKVATVGEAKLQGADLSEDNHAAAIELGVKLLMGSVREYLLSGYGGCPWAPWKKSSTGFRRTYYPSKPRICKRS